MKRRPTAWLVGVVCGVAAAPLLAAAPPVARWLSRPLVESDPLRRVDAIVVLGAGAYDDTTLTPDSAYRLLHGLTLFLQGYAPVVILSGGGHRGNLVSDAQVMARVATALGIPTAALILDDTPSSTAAQAASVTAIAGRRSLRSIMVVTSPLHSRRAVGVFRRMGLDVVSAPGFTRLTRVPVSVAQDHVAGRLGVIVQALYEYAALGAYWWRGWI